MKYTLKYYDIRMIKIINIIKFHKSKNNIYLYTST